MILAPSRNLYLPSWWRLPWRNPLAAEMAHLQKSSTTGHLLKTSTGHLSKACAGRCNCDSYVWTVSVSGMSDGCCVGKHFHAATCNKTYTGVDTTTAPPQVGDPVCTYRIDDFSTEAWEQYANSDCTGSVTNNTGSGVHFYFRYYSDATSGDVSLQTKRFTIVSTNGTVFDATAVDDDLCIAVGNSVTFTNVVTLCASGGPILYRFRSVYGGSATCTRTA